MNNQENLYQQGLDYWQRYGETYSENMSSIFEKNLEQSKVFQDQLQKAVAEVVDSQFNLMISGLKALENQTAKLTNSMDEILKTETTE
jgi:hypothetical protein